MVNMFLNFVHNSEGNYGGIFRTTLFVVVVRVSGDRSTGFRIEAKGQFNNSFVVLINIL